MSPDISFHLTNDAYDHFAELLHPHGITVRDVSHSTGENLEQGRPVSESHAGFLNYNGFDFSYRRRKSIAPVDSLMQFIPRDNPNVQVFTTYLNVTCADFTNIDILEELFDRIELAFPQPKRPKRLIPPQRPWTKARIRSRVGCLILLLFFFLSCFFITYGIRAFFRGF